MTSGRDREAASKEAASVYDDDVAALRRLIDYAIDEALKQGLFRCARSLREARCQIAVPDELSLERLPRETSPTRSLAS